MCKILDLELVYICCYNLKLNMSVQVELIKLYEEDHGAMIAALVKRLSQTGNARESKTMDTEMSIIWPVQNLFFQT